METEKNNGGSARIHAEARAPRTWGQSRTSAPLGGVLRDALEKRVHEYVRSVARGEDVAKLPGTWWDGKPMLREVRP